MGGALGGYTQWDALFPGAATQAGGQVAGTGLTLLLDIIGGRAQQCER